MKKNLLFIILCITCIILAACYLPIISTKCILPVVSAELLVRGYNLIEFSAAGAVPAIMPYFAICIFPFCRSNKKRLLLTLGFIALELISYICSLAAAIEWLEREGSTDTVLHCGAALYPVVAAAAILYTGAYFSCKTKFDYMGKDRGVYQ